MGLDIRQAKDVRDHGWGSGETHHQLKDDHAVGQAKTVSVDIVRQETILRRGGHGAQQLEQPDEDEP